MVLGMLLLWLLLLLLVHRLLLLLVLAHWGAVVTGAVVATASGGAIAAVCLGSGSGEWCCCCCWHHFRISFSSCCMVYWVDVRKNYTFLAPACQAGWTIAVGLSFFTYLSLLFRPPVRESNITSFFFLDFFSNSQRDARRHLEWELLSLGSFLYFVSSRKIDMQYRYETYLSRREMGRRFET